MWFTQVSLRNPVFATMVMLAFVVLGAFSLQRLQVDQFPNIDFPVVVVTTTYPGASPEIVESEVTKKVEEAVNAIAGVNSLTSRSYEGTSVVIIEFQLTVDGRKAADDVREKIGILRPLLRDEVDEPRVLRFDPASRAIWSVAVVPDAVDGRTPSGVELSTWADQVLKKRLENVRGVGSVTLVGATRRAINIELDPVAMQALGVTTEQVNAAVRSENQDLPVGTLKAGESERVVQVLSRLHNPRDFEDIIVARRGGSPVRLGQVARVSDGTQEVESLSLYNGQRTLLLQVQKAQDENTIAVVDGLNAALSAVKPELPPGVRLEPIADGARPIRVSVQNVRQTLIEGAILTVLIVFLFLNSWRSTVITGLTLPIAIIGTFFVMNALGFTINMMTLMALTLSVGLLIDDAIVVLENIVRHVQMGKTPYQAAMEGTQEIGLAVLATTLSIVAVFLPIGFMGGIIGKFFHEFGITMVAAVLISMFVSFTLDPMLSSVWHDPAIDAHGKPPGRSLYDRTLGRVTHWFDRFQDDLAEGYQGALRWSLRHKLATLGLALATFIGSLAMLPLLGSEFVPQADFSEASVSYHTPVGSSLVATEAKAREVEAILRGFPEVRYTLTTINTGAAQGSMYASTYVRLVNREERALSAVAMAATLRERLRAVPGVTVTHAGLLDAVGGGKQIEFSLQGDDLDELERLSALITERLRPIVGLVDLDSSLKPDKPTVDVVLKRELASDLGLSTNAIGNSLRTLVAGTTVGNWRAQNGETYDVTVRLPPPQRQRTQDLLQLPLNLGAAADGSARTVPLSQVADVVEATGPNQINRRNLKREVSFSANVYGRSTGEVSAEIQRVVSGIALPPGYRTEFSGSTKNMQESFGYALSALALAIIFIYMILASQFQSFLQPLSLMTSLPLTLIGVVLALLMFGSTMSMFSIIGIVLLMGLVTKNAILLVDFAIRAREGRAGGPPLPRDEALLLAAKVRLRPILMTTLAMVFGMVPLAFALTEGSEQRAPMGQAVIGGVITSSLLTLVVVPVVYGYLDDFANWLRRKAGLPPAVTPRPDGASQGAS
ncbi:MAG: AcrB/AcrD/AcrF family protein [Hydrogenophaga sp.]|uniref:efflux RND transporter permease subunit n=1 Tax=Hydrogenophaga sp. TaxID=1904254 RepID=UPI001699769B|nr:efflux RND transporter permease subunit [Hydrogenophaga sp.]NIM41789.1 AcrB/AcrD/AcrF family protein [Hydrogenophaga sp.]NIN27094.1 AcrB/AcrD/AcrF family protein [Hydrogenophaga sp.]NIN31795.1 AcrB/AcrD/AcrF family protein [Hydrogenophaga sp.]NIN56039.1 AcrB/AcrD/AcrF family protein [Hydrogenophaga sp.]NIO52166.1 AcrB/AcrD/AcrF family protein [Hydrogenophaga sp.]